MFARSVSFHLKPGCAAEFTQLLDKQIIPVLWTQKGFQDELALVARGEQYGVGLSIWDRKEDADTYASATYPGVLEALAQVIAGTPQVHTYEVTSSTFHKLIARAGLDRQRG
jgi:hypothetical protein